MWQIQFCFFKLSGFFSFFNIFYPRLVESVDAEPTDTEGQLYMFAQEHF